MPFPLEHRFDNRNFFIQLGVARPPIPERITEEAQKRGYLEKPETHISIVVTSNAVRLKEFIATSDAPDARTEEILHLFKSFPWEYELRDEYHLQEKLYRATSDRPEHTRRTIVQMVSLPDLPLFYEKLAVLVPVPFTLPVPHITLFSWSDYEPMMVQGIGLSSREDLEACDRGQI